MKKLFSFLLLTFTLMPSLKVLSTPYNPDFQEIVFVYIHGAKNYSKNDQEIFEKKIYKLHSEILKELYDSDIVKEQISENRTLFIEEPEIFYWGGEVKEDIAKLENEFQIFKDIYEKFSLSSFVRKSLGFALHDMVWLAKSNSKHRIIDDLMGFLKDQRKKNRKVIFLAYSAGSIVLYDLMIYTTKYINFYETAKDRNLPVSFEDLSVSNVPKYTCIKALEKNKMTKVDESGDLIGAFDKIEFEDKHDEEGFLMLKQDYLLERLRYLDQYTNDYCIPDNFVAGIITFGSPITVSRSTGGSNIDRAFKPLIKHFYEEDIFWLNINHSKDIFAYPIYSYNDELIFRELDAYNPSDHENEINPQGGVIVNNFSKTRGSSILGAHGWYLNKPKSFAKLIVDTYEEAYTSVYQN